MLSRFNLSYLLFAALGLSSFILHQGVFYLFAQHSPFFTVQNINIQGLQFASDYVSPLIENTRGKPLYTLNIMQLKSNISASPIVEQAVLEKIYPSTLKATITERRPVALIYSGENIYVVDKMGRILPQKPYANLPRLYVNFGLSLNDSQIVDEYLRETLYSLNTLTTKNISQISLHRETGTSFRLKESSIDFYITNRIINEKFVKTANNITASLKTKKIPSPKIVDLSSGNDTAVGYN